MADNTVPTPPVSGQAGGTETPWFRRPWGIALVVLGVVAILYALGGGDDEQPVTGGIDEGEAADEPDADAEPEHAPDPVHTEESVAVETTEPEGELPANIEPAPFEVASVEETGLGRIDSRVVVAGQPDQETLIATARAAVLHLREAFPYTGAFVFLYAEHDPTDGTYTLARAIDAPGGDIANAAETTAGQYDGHVIVIDAREKDWSEQPSAEDAIIYNEWMELNDELWDVVEFEELDDETDRRLAERLGMHPDEVAQTVNRVSMWLFSGEEIQVQR